MHETGEGGTKDYKLAVSAYEQACDLGSSRGCYNLAAMYKRGHGVPVDNTIAISLNRKSCALGYKPACGDNAIKD